MLELKNIIKNYFVGETKVEALKGVSLKFRESEFVSVLGPSGCGKTTLLNIIGGLDKYTSGDLIINGKSTKEYKDRDWDSYRNHSVGFVFQSYNLIPHQTVLENVEIALTLSGVSKAERRERAIKVLKDVGLGDQINKKPNEMSGGQMQRVAIARALVNDPDILLADEPTGALDSTTSVQVMDILKEVAKDRLVIMVTHNPELANSYSSRIINMLDGEIIDDTMPVLDDEFEEIKQVNKVKEAKKGKEKKPTMSFFTALKLSLKNLFTKKARTTLTSFAGSIGIIGIALILAVSQGTTAYIDYVQETTLSSYPIVLESTSLDLTSMMESFMGIGGASSEHDNDAIYKDPIISDLVNALSKVDANENDLKSFKTYLETEMNKEGSSLSNAITGVKYSYDIEFDIYSKNVDGEIIKSDTNELMTDMIAEYMLLTAGKGNSSGNTGDNSSNQGGNGMFSMMMTGGNMWQELLSAKDGAVINDLIYEQYDKIYGEWPTAYDEVVLVINENNELDDLTLYALGLISEEEIDAIIDAAVNGEELPPDNKKWTYQEVCEREFKTILPSDYYDKLPGMDTFIDLRNFPDSLEELYNNHSLKLKVTGVIRPNPDAENHMISGSIGYTYKLTDYVLNKASNSDVVKEQMKAENQNIDVLTGRPFKESTGTLTDAEKKQKFIEYVQNQTVSQKAETYVAIKCIMPETELMQGVMLKMANYPTKELKIDKVAKMIAEETEVNVDAIKGYLAETSDEYLNQLLFGVLALEVQGEYADNKQVELSTYTPEQLASNLDSEINGYTDAEFVKYYDNVTKFSDSTYEDNLIKFGYAEKDSPASISIYASSFENKDVIISAIKTYNSGVSEEKQIKYTDYMGLMMSSITTIIDAITYVLIAFVAISLVVSSIMIGVITLISVQERTKEIGILRAIGASKKDVSSMFNAETLIIGFTSGLLGVLVTYLLCIPINLILRSLTGINALRAFLPVPAALILVAISMLLTLIAGIIPSRSAAKKDPVVALRTE